MLYRNKLGSCAILPYRKRLGNCVILLYRNKFGSCAILLYRNKFGGCAVLCVASFDKVAPRRLYVSCYHNLHCISTCTVQPFDNLKVT